MAKKQLIRLTESDLNKIIKESVKNILRENKYDFENQTWELVEQVKECLGSDKLCNLLISRLAGQIDWKGAYLTLKEIYEIECNNNIDED